MRSPLRWLLILLVLAFVGLRGSILHARKSFAPAHDPITLKDAELIVVVGQEGLGINHATLVFSKGPANQPNLAAVVKVYLTPKSKMTRFSLKEDESGSKDSVQISMRAK